MFKKKQKYFCVGFNKTGTTSVEAVFKNSGLKTAQQGVFSKHLPQIINGDYKGIIAECKKYDAFQDIPFSLPYFFIILKTAFPDSKFILTKRSSAEEWYNSLVKFHSKIITEGFSVPTYEQIMQYGPKWYKGFIWDYLSFIADVPQSNPYDKALLTDAYELHNENVERFFKSTPESLITINVSDGSDYSKFCDFVNVPQVGTNFPWENRT